MTFTCCSSDSPIFFMTIGIITSDLGMLSLFEVLHHSHHRYIIYYDRNHAFWSDHSQSLTHSYVQAGIHYLDAMCDHIIIPPIFEMLTTHPKVLPLYRSYIHNAFQSSKIGKIWRVGDHYEISQINSLFPQLATSHQLTEHQSHTKWFHHPMARWTVHTPLWKYLYETLPHRSRLIHNLIKTDLRKLSDAGVDTVIPLNYAYLHRSKSIMSYLWSKTQRHGWWSIQHIRNQMKIATSDHYTVEVHHKGPIHHLHTGKWLGFLSCGNPENIVWVDLWW